MEERRKLIVGHFGDPKQDKQKIEESLTPSHYAISLSGEPTMYPKLPDLIKSYMPSTIFEDPYLMIELIKLDINSIADISKKLKKNKKFMSKVKKLLDEK